jgi:TusA-related sulfurtransferase
MSAASPAPQSAVLDCLGKPCPVPVIELARAVAELEVGQEIVLLSDDPGAKVDIPVWCRMKRQELRASEQDGAVFRFTVRRVQ